MLAIDDLQWCDRASLRFIAYLAGRLEGQPMLLAATLRSGDPGTDPALLAEIAHVPGQRGHPARPVQRRRGRGAGPRAARPERRAGLLRGLPRGDRRQPAAAGAAAERAARPTGCGPTAQNAGAGAATSARGRSRGRCCCGSPACPSRRSAVARAVAVLGDGADLATVAALAGLDEARGRGGRRASSRGPRSCAGDPPLRFVHPLVRDAVYERARAGRARARARPRGRRDDRGGRRRRGTSPPSCC